MSEYKKTILLVTDDATAAGFSALHRLSNEYRIIQATDALKVQGLLGTNIRSIDLLLVDVNPPPGTDVPGIVREANEANDIPVLLLASEADGDALADAGNGSVYGFVQRDAGAAMLAASIENALALHAMRLVQREKKELLAESEQRLSRSEARFRRYFELPLLGMAITSPEKRWIEVNDTACAMLGYSKQELAGMTWADLTHPEDLAEELVLFNSVIEGRIDSYTVEKRFIKKQGDVIWTMLAVGCERGAGGAPEYFIALLLDITDRKRAEEALRQSELRFRTIADFTYDWEYWQAADGSIVYMSPSCETISGYRAGEFIERPSLLDQIVRREDRIAWTEHQARRKESDEALSSTFSIAHRSGETRWIEHVCRPVYDGEKVLRGYRVSNRDVSDRMRAEESLRQSREMFYKTFQSSPVSLIIARLSDARFIEVNGTFEKNTGWTREEVIGRSALELGLWDDSENRGHIWYRFLTEGRVNNLEVRFRDRAGKLRIGSFSSVLIELRSEPCFLITFVDVTDRAQAEEALRQSLQEKELLMRELQHRVKNNLNTITSLLGLEMDRLPDNLSRQIFIDTQLRIRSMAAIYERLYRSAGVDRIELGLYIGELANSIFQTFSAERASLRLLTGFDDIVLGVRQAMPLGLIVNELLTNALKYAYPPGSSGEVRIKLGLRDGTGSLEISDDGSGMPQGFSPDTAESMGLRLVKLLARQIGGGVRIDSVKGKGTTVMVSFMP